MKTILQEHFSLIFFIVLFISAISITAVAQQQTPADWLRQIDEIPIIASLDYDWAYPNRSEDIDSMKRAGIDAVILSIANGIKMQVLRDWENGGFRVIPVKSINSNLDTLNWITYYTDAKYTIWETEDITPEDTSYILHDPNIMDEITLGSDKFLKLKSSAAENVNSLIWGPYYSQNVFEQNIQGFLDTAIYTADFRMKLELNNGYSDNIHPDTPLCIIQVTQSRLAVPNTWTLDCTYPINSIVITRRNFQLLNQFQNFSFAYNLGCDSCSQTTSTPPQYYPPGYSLKSSELSDIEKFLMMREYIEFKVKWLGKPNYLLSIDKATVYDQKGFEIIDPTSDARSRIELQANSLNTYNNNITGWLGIDEPNSIDKYAPVKRVNEILNNYSNNARPLWLSIMGKWDGVWDNYDNPFGTYHLSPWKEMTKRIGNINIWQDVYYLDYPWNSDECNNCTEPWYSENIKIAAELNYKQAYDLDNYFGVSIQCGEIHIDGVAEQRNINESELLYETNLALMYGTKFLSLYTYFAQRDTSDTTQTGTKHGIIDFEAGNLIYTPKFDMLRDNINPRLKGLMGKTLKKLTPTEQLLNAAPLELHNFVNILFHWGEAPYETGLDLGFFKDINNLDYFMLINRWYNSGSYSVPLSFNSNYFGNYNNIQLYNLIDSTKQTIQNNGIIYTNIALGDALF